MSKKLFKNFNEVSEKAWKQKIQVDLKGLDYNDTLIHKTNDGIHVKPFYHKDSFKNLDIPLSDSETIIGQVIFIDNEKIAHGIALEALEKGAKCIRFIAEIPFDYKLLCNSFKPNDIIIFELHFFDKTFIEKMLELVKDKNISITIDPIHNFTSTGNWFTSFETDFNEIKQLTNNYSRFNIAVDAKTYQNSGATITQQITYALAHLNEYLNHDMITDSSEVNVIFAMGSNYFFEIAKLRAFRYLFKELMAIYQLKASLNIFAEPSRRNKTIYDYNVNLLRTTTENMSAFLGNANVVFNTAYDSIYHRSNEFGTRIARNQNLILQEESYFKSANNPAKGSYYLEQITYELAEKSLKIFKEIEKNKGFIAQLIKGSIQRKIEESATKEQQQFDEGKLVLLGTNKYPNPNDKMANDLELYPFLKVKPRKTIIKPIIEKRLAEKMEQERLKKE